MNIYKRSDWCFFIDCDEFFVPKQCNSVSDFVLPFQEYCAVAINWLNFGSSGQLHWQDAMTIDRFKKCSSYKSPWNKYFKCFHRPTGPFTALGVHRPWPIEPTQSFVYVDGTPVDAEIQLGGDPATAQDPTVLHSISSLNHYSLRSWEEYKRKEVRGNGFITKNGYGGKNKFINFDDNSNENDDIARFTASARSMLNAYLAHIPQVNL